MKDACLSTSLRSRLASITKRILAPIPNSRPWLPSTRAKNVPVGCRSPAKSCQRKKRWKDWERARYFTDTRSCCSWAVCCCSSGGKKVYSLAASFGTLWRRRRRQQAWRMVGCGTCRNVTISRVGKKWNAYQVDELCDGVCEL
jgi:hypothetical protein